MKKEKTEYDSLPQFDLDINGLTVHYVDVGSGLPVLLIHGSPVSSFLFRHQIGALSERFRIIAPDLLGFGKSFAPANGVAFAEQSSLLRGLLDRLGLDRYALVGHDWGGPVGMAAAIQKIEQLSHLVLINTILRSDFRPPWYWRPYILPAVGELLLVRLNLAGRGLPRMMRAARDRSVHARYLDPMRRPGTRRTVLALERLTGYQELMREVEAVVPSLEIPTLILWGFPDVYFRPLEMERLHALLPHASVQTIAEGGHFPQEDAPERVTEALLDFFQQREEPTCQRL